MNLKMIHDDGANYHVQAPSGHVFHVEKKSLSPEGHEWLHRATGGGIPSALMTPEAYEAAGNSTEYTPPPEPMVGMGVSSGGGAPVQPIPATEEQPAQAAPAGVVEGQPVSSAPEGVPAANPLAQASAANISSEDKMLTELEKAKKGFGGEGAAYNQFLSAMPSGADTKVETPQAIQARHAEADKMWLSKIMNDEIDPNRYMHSLGTGQKILSGIGIALSGMGGGSTGRNLALDQINGAITRDIEQQKATAAKHMNLWKMNREATQDDLQANLATQNQLLSVAQAKAARSAAGAKSVEERLRLQQLIMGIEGQKAQNQKVQGILGASGQSPSGMKGVMTADPLTLVPMLVPEKHQDKAIKEINDAKYVAEKKNEIRRLLNELGKDARPATGMSFKSMANALPGYHPQSYNSLKVLFDPLIHDEVGRVNEFEKQDVLDNFPAFGDSDARVQEKVQHLMSYTDSKRRMPTLQAFSGLSPDHFVSTSGDMRAKMSPEEYRSFEWARANPNAPKAKAILNAWNSQATEKGAGE